MSEKHRCKHCHQVFPFRPQNPNQQYCSKSECQKARKRQWQRLKLLADPAYQANQGDAQHCWQEKHPTYWQEYRARHPDYVERNRTQQRERNRRRRVRQGTGPGVIAKMDASTPENIINPGRYRLSCIDSTSGGLIAKMDALIVEINVVSSA